MARTGGTAARERLVDSFVTASRALVAVAVRSIAASPVEVTVAQHRLLVLLAADGDQMISLLAEKLGVDPSNASRLCDRLQRLGLVDRRRSDADRRAVCITLTAAGREVIETVGEQRRAEIRRLLADVPAAEVDAIIAALNAFAEAAGEPDDAEWALG